jgi:thiol-disulfide isomerase/thioredoxin
VNKNTLVIIGILFGIVLVSGGVFAYTSNQNNKKQQDKMAMEKKTEAEAMVKKDEAAAMENDKMAKDGEAMSKQGSYVTLEDYNKDTSKYADSKKVYFFHANWCPICQGIEKEITADMSKIPAGVTLIKTDFDTATVLRKQYGVTQQYTFVQFDNSGTQTKKWSATSLADVVSQIQ